MKALSGLFLVAWLLLGAVTSAQEVQEYPVMDFSGGMVNSIANSLMKDNQALVFENYQVTPFGAITARTGYHYFYNDSFTVAADKMVPYFGAKNQKIMFSAKAMRNSSSSDSIARNVDVVTSCNDASGICGTVLYNGLTKGRRVSSVPFNSEAANITGKMVLGQSKSELLIFNDSILYPARPLGPGQPRAIPIDGAGHVNGVVQYKYLYKANAGTDTSNLSSPSFPVYVNHGKVAILGLVDDPLADTVLMYRKVGRSGKYEFLTKFPAGQTYYFDTTTSTNHGDTTKYEWGPNAKETGGSSGACSASNLEPPGAPTITISSVSTTHYGIGDTSGTTSPGYCWGVQYSVVFVDLNGNESYMSPPASYHVDTFPNWKRKASLTNIPVPLDSGIAYKKLLRMPLPVLLQTGTAFNSWYQIDSLNPWTTTYTDSLPAKDNYITDNLYCPKETEVDTVTLAGGSAVTTTTTTQYGDIPEVSCRTYDSVITFQPTSFVVHGFRMFAVGSIDEPQGLYYSDFGKPAVWPPDKFIVLPTRLGDHLVRLYSLEDRLLILRENSIYQLTGLQFAQFQLSEVISGVGLTSARSLAGSLNDVYFAHTSGVYGFSRFSGIGKTPISFPIQNSVDSITTMPSTTGNMLKSDYWFSTGTKSYVYVSTPAPYWASYSISVTDAVLYDKDTMSLVQGGGKFITILGNDSTAIMDGTDTLDGTRRIVKKYRSKYYFDDLNRERIMWVDFIGSGKSDSFEVKVYDNDNELILTRSVALDFSKNKRQRVKIDKITTKCSVMWTDKGYGRNTIRGYVIGWIPWDRGRSL